LIRGERPEFKSKEQQLEFNFPFQLAGWGAKAMCTANDAVSIDLQLNLGDAVVVGTDGLFDNIFPEEIIKALGPHLAVANQ